MDVIILLGAPGSGKGTSAERIREKTRYVHVSTGDMLRAAVKQGTAVGHEAEGYMKRGELVPDEVIIRLVEERLDAGKADDCYMLDGFPRTTRQADLLAQTLTRRGGGRKVLSTVFLLDAPESILMERLCGRRVCRKCGQNYHVKNVPPKQAGICDLCGGELYHRPDDQEATIKNRLDVYTKQTESLIAYYEKQGVLVRVNSGQPADKTVAEVLAHLKKSGSPAL